MYDSRLFPMSTYVIFGASGDLFTKKLVPAFERLFAEGALSHDTRLIGVSRKTWSDEDFRNRIAAIAPGIPRECMSFVSGDVTDVDLAGRFAGVLKSEPVIFYCALSPLLYTDALRLIEGVRLQNNLDVRVLIEKPFGRNSVEAQKLNTVIDETVGEARVFRVDHYLYKEPLEHLVVEDETVSRVEVFLHEEETLGERGVFYDTTGAVADVVGNHLIEVLALLTMDRQTDASPETVRRARADMLSRIQIIPKDSIRGQYMGYRATPGVQSDSITETYVRLLVRLDHPRWKDIPVTLEAGKALPQRKGAVRIYFKDPATPYFELLLAPLPIDRAYDRVLHAATSGDRTRFVSRDEAMAAAGCIDRAHEVLTDIPLTVYEVGTLPRVIS